jgi:hypothetical protein
MVSIAPVISILILQHYSVPRYSLQWLLRLNMVSIAPVISILILQHYSVPPLYLLHEIIRLRGTDKELARPGIHLNRDQFRGNSFI